MNKDVIKPPSLEFFFERLHDKFGDFLVLRGYEFLPQGYTNDIDVYVPKSDLARFFGCVASLEGLNARIEILISRLGLIKCDLHLDGEVIPFDVLYGFYYFGLEYQDCKQLSRNSRSHACELFSVPALSDEIRISLLKELLHNSRVRSDKAVYLSEMMKECSANLPTSYFSADTIDVVYKSILGKDLFLPKLSRGLKFGLLYHNLSRSFFQTIKSILLFASVKYIYKNSYHERIAEK